MLPWRAAVKTLCDPRPNAQESWLRSQDDDGSGQLSGSGAIDRERSGAPDHDGQANGNGQNVVFVAFAFLVAKPVGKKTKVPVDQDDGDHHVGADAKSSHAAEESDQQTDATKEFRGNGQNREYCGNVHLLSEKA